MPGPKRKKEESENPKKTKPKQKRAPAKTFEAAEQQLIHLSTKEAEKRIKNGTATSQILLHYLKMGSVTEELSREKLRNENRLLEAKVEQIASAQRIEELYANAIIAMRDYGGKKIEPDEEEDYD